METLDWHSVRGAQMITLMKIVSYAHDMATQENARIESTLQCPLDAAQNTSKVEKLSKPEDERAKKLQGGSKNEEKKESDLHSIVTKPNKSMTETSGEQRVRPDKKKSNVRNRKKVAGDPRDTVTSCGDINVTSDTSDNGSSHSVRSNTKEEEHCADSAGGGSLVWRGVLQGVELCGYLLHPGTVVFGPWCSVATYRQIHEPFKWVGN